MKHSDALKALAPVDLSKPSLEALAYLLRHKELWPAGFEWNFDECDTCAIGLTTRVWDVAVSDMQRTFGLSDELYVRIVGHGAYSVVRKVTANDVATRIDSYLEEIRS